MSGDSTIKQRPTMLITGAASGLGAALAQLAVSRYELILVDIDKERGEKITDQLNTERHHATFYYANVGRLKDLEQLVQRIQSKYQTLDVLVNNAGVASYGSLEDASEQEWQRLININLLSVARLTRLCLPLLRNSQKAAIINVASFAALAQMPGMMVYNVVKVGVLSLSESLRAELISENIQVSCLCPSFFATNLTDSMDQSSPHVIATVKRWMANASVSASQVAALILDGVNSGKFLLLMDKKSRNQYRLLRWFPEFFFKQKVKFIKVLNKK